jgi:hypothetical protein
MRKRRLNPKIMNRARKKKANAAKREAVRQAYREARQAELNAAQGALASSAFKEPSVLDQLPRASVRQRKYLNKLKHKNA